MFWKKDRPKIKFHTTEQLLNTIPHPVPAAKAMPNWFKKIKPFVKGKDKADNGTIKRCMPVLDVVSEGFIIPLWADLQVKVSVAYRFMDKDGKEVHIEPTDDPDKFIGLETKVTKEVMVSYEKLDDLSVWLRFPEGFDLGKESLGSHSWEQVGNACDLKKFKLGKVLMKFTNPWTIQTPKGYSVKFKNPANNWSNNIEIIEGIVDTDEYYNPTNFPFVWTGSEVGEWIIPQSTPLVHVIPFKRETYKLEVGLVNDKKSYLVYNKLSARFIDRYKNLFWHKRKDR